jgi:hypothetical protein
MLQSGRMLCWISRALSRSLRYAVLRLSLRWLLSIPLTVIPMMSSVGAISSFSSFVLKERTY